MFLIVFFLLCAMCETLIIIFAQILLTFRHNIKVKRDDYLYPQKNENINVFVCRLC